MTVGLLEILVIFLVFLVLGPRRITNIFRSLGRGIQDFTEQLGRDKKEELSEEERDEDQR
jgi:sec-independent protein translocase protein TatA